jgi:hypothetical protein
LVERPPVHEFESTDFDARQQHSGWWSGVFAASVSLADEIVATIAG